MKNIFGPILTLLFIYPVIGISAPSLVRSGEHANFSRIVANIPSESSWEVSHVGNRVILKVNDLQEGFDTSQVFDLIPRNRILSVEQTNNTLELLLGCDCRVAAFTVQNAFVVLDVAAEDQVLGTPFIPLVSSVVQSVSLPSATPPLGRESLIDDQNLFLHGLRHQLAQELGNAATRGILTPSQQGPKRRDVQSDMANTLVPDPPLVPKSNMDEDVNASIRISTSRDVPRTDPVTETKFSDLGSTCVDNSVIALQNWGDRSSFSSQIGSARQALFGEFDQLDPEAVHKLAKRYVFFGFGAEAKKVLEMDGNSRSDIILQGMAEILDQGFMEKPRVLAEMLGCEGDIALWALLASRRLDTQKDFDAGPALRALNKLPLHLRRSLAPLLAERLRNYGASDEAATALRSLERTIAPLSPDGEIISAQLSLDSGDVSHGADRLLKVVEENSTRSPEALIKLIETKFSNNLPIDFQTAKLVSAFAKEFRGTDLGLSLQRAHILTLLGSGQYDRAFAKKNLQIFQKESSEFIALRELMLGSLIDTSEDIIFLDLALAEPMRNVTRFPVKMQINLAKRFLKLGFAENAQKVIEAIPDQPRNSTRQLLAARIAIALQQPFKATADLLGMDEPEANEIRALASDMAGTHEEAYELYRLTENSEQSVRAAWLADAWDNPTIRNDPVLGPIVTLSLAAQPETIGREGMLALSSEALEESALARDALADLLEATRIQIPSNAVLD